MSAIIASPIKRHGGKGGYHGKLARWIVSLMPPHVTFIEPFFGSGAVLFARGPGDDTLFFSDHRDHAGVSEIVNDLDGQLVNFFRILRDEKTFPHFVRQVDAMPVSRVEWEAANEHVGGEDPVADAVAFFTDCRQSRQALCKDFATVQGKRLRRGMNEHVSAWLSAIEGLPDVHKRLRRVVIENMPAVDLIRRHDAPTTLFYCDPPYPHETRTVRTAYGKYEMSTDDHRELLAVLQQCKGKVMLSGYPSKLYDDHLAGWAKHIFQIPNQASGKKVKDVETEVVWTNF
jgi:DNA adenine methylase